MHYISECVGCITEKGVVERELASSVSSQPCCNTSHTSKNHFRLKFREISFVYKLFPSFLIVSKLCTEHDSGIVFFSCDQAALWMVQSVRPSVRLSVCLSVRLSVTPFWLCSHHRIIMKFSGVFTMVKSDVHAKGQVQRSKVKVTEVNTQLSRFRTLTPVWIHIWQWNHAHSWKQHRRGALLFFKVIRQISRSHGSKNRRIWPRLGVSGL